MSSWTLTYVVVTIVSWTVPANVRGIASSESWTRGSSAAFTSSSGTSTCRSQHRFPHIKHKYKNRQKGKNRELLERFLHCGYNVHSSPFHSTLWESCSRGTFCWNTKRNERHNKTPSNVPEQEASNAELFDTPHDVVVNLREGCCYVQSVQIRFKRFQ